jgi:peptide/nickel transport system substrate-binding protein
MRSRSCDDTVSTWNLSRRLHSSIPASKSREGRVMMRRLALVLVAVIAVLAFGQVSGSGAASPSAARSTAAIPLIRMGLPYRATSLDNARSSTSLDLAPLLLDPLITLGSDSKLKPWLATSWTKRNPTTYVFRLRHGVKFWDGTEMTSVDVANSLNWNRFPAFASSLVSGLKVVKDVRATSRYAVLIKLRHPDSSFLYQLASPAGEIFQAKAQLALANKQNFGQPGATPVGTGPWMLQSLDPTRGAELSANPRYWGGKVDIQHITVSFFTDETNEALAFRAGQLDVVPRVVGQQAFASAANTTLIGSPSCRIGYLNLSTKAAPWNDVHVRRAVALAIGRSGIISATTGDGFGDPLYTLIPRVQLGLLGSPAQVKAALKSVPTNSTNLTKAKQELAKSAHPNGFSAEMIAPQFSNWPAGTQAIAGQLAAIGINAKVTVLPFSSWLAKTSGPVEDRPTFFGTSSCLNPDPSFYPSSLLGSGGLNWASYASPATDQLVLSGVVASDPAKRLAIYTKILKRVAADVPIVPIFAQRFTGAISSGFKWPKYNSVTYFAAPWAGGIQKAG